MISLLVPCMVSYTKLLCFNIHLFLLDVWTLSNTVSFIIILVFVMPFFLSFFLFHSFVRCFFLSFFHSFNLSFFLSFFLCTLYLPYLLSVCLSVCLYVLLSFLRSFVRSFVFGFTLLVSHSYNRRCTRSCLILLPLLGITWMFGLLSLAGFGIQFDYVFTALNSVQVSGYISSILVPDTCSRHYVLGELHKRLFNNKNKN